MATVTSVGSGNYNTGSTWDSGARPGSSDDVVIASGHTVTLVQAENANSLDLQSGGTLDGDGNLLTIVGENSSGFAVNLDGAISGTDTDIRITTAATTLIDIVPTSGNVRHLTINHASFIGTFLGNTSISGNLLITMGELKSAGSNSLTVAGALANDGTLTLNASTLNLGSTSAEAGDVTGTGTFNLDTSTINFHTGGGANFIPSTSANFDTNTSTLNLIGLNGSNRAHNFNFASGNMHNITTSRGAGTDTHTETLNGNCTITGDLTVGANSIFDTGSDRDLTVTGATSVTGTLTGNASAISLGSLTIASGGTYSATSGTTTITSENGTKCFDNQSGGTFTHNNGTLKFASSIADTTFDNAGADDFYNLTCETNGDCVYLNAITVLNNLTINNSNANFKANTDASGAITVRGITKLVDGIAFSTSDDNANADHYGFIVIEGGTFRISDTSSATKTCDGIRNIGGTLSG